MNNKVHFVFPFDLDVAEYSLGYARGTQPDRLPYGIESMPAGFSVSYATRSPSSRAAHMIGRACRRVLGIDLMQAFRSIRLILSADIVYGHTEHEYLAAALVLRALRQRRQILVGQSIWVSSDWEQYPRWRKHLFMYLFRRVDLSVYNSVRNCEWFSRQFPDRQHRYIPFGASRLFDGRTNRPTEPPMILAVGNDRFRDWEILAAVRTQFDDRYRWRAATRYTPSESQGIEYAPAASMDELVSLYESAALVVILTNENNHASGITVALEAATVGTPIVASSNGGIESYFEPPEVEFVEDSSANSVARLIDELLNDPARSRALTVAAQQAVKAQQLSLSGYWDRILAQVAMTVSDRETIAPRSKSAA